MTSLPERWHPKSPTKEAVIRRLTAEIAIPLPETFLDLLRVSNGGYAELSASPWAVDFWPAEDIRRLNQEYGVDQKAPDFIAFGSNLGEEVLAFDKRDGARSGVYLLPWHAPNPAEALKIADSFEILTRMMI